MRPLDVFIIIGITLIWGLNFVATKAVVTYFPVFFLLGFRLLIVALLLLPFLKVSGISLRRVFLISFILTVVHFSLMFFALQMGLNVNVAVVVDQLRVPFAALVGVLLLREQLSLRSIVGMAVALMGTFVLMETPNVLGNSLAFLLALASALAWAFYNVQVKYLGRMKLFSFIGLISLFGSMQLLLLSGIFEHNQLELVKHMPLPIFGWLMYMVLAATITAHGTWYHLLCKYPINVIAPYTLLVPVFGMIFSMILLHEPMGLNLLSGALLTLAGVTMIVTRRPTAVKGGQAT